MLQGSANNAKQPNAIYDYLNNKFLVTFWDSITGKLSLAFKDINFTNPDVWTPYALSQYNDTTANIEDAKPRVSLNPISGRTNLAWISGSVSFEGTIYFDSNQSVVSVNDLNAEAIDFSAFPNPASSSINFYFTLAKPTAIAISIKDVSGREIKTVKAQNFATGKNSILFDTSNLASGCYFYSLHSADFTITNKLIISQH